MTMFVVLSIVIQINGQAYGSINYIVAQNCTRVLYLKKASVLGGVYLKVLQGCVHSTLILVISDDK